MSMLAVSVLLNTAMGAAVIHVDVSAREATPVPRTFFGQFGEHLGDNVQNGLWAQILRNPSFEGYAFFEGQIEGAKQGSGLGDVDAGRELGLAYFWLPEGQAEYALDEDNPFNSALSQRMEVKEQGGIRAPVMLPVHRVSAYEVSFYARASAEVRGTAGFSRDDGTVLCEQPVSIEGGEWKRHALSLNLPEGCKAGERYSLVFRFEGPATVWLDQAELFPADHQDGLDPDVVRLMKELKVSLLRFPGGNFVSGYHWRDGIGPRDKRVTMRNPAWPMSELNHVGTDEWMTFVRAIGAEPMICVNVGNGTVEEAADWVRYCNEPADGEIGKLRAANGHPEPYKVKYWEVGNELYGDWQVGHCSPEEYATRHDAFAPAMLEADPSILLIANGGPEDWDERFLKTVKEPVRSVSMHRLIGEHIPKDVSAEDMVMALAAYGLDFDRQLEAMKDMYASSGHPDTKVAITEIMSWARRPGLPRSHSTHTEVAYFAGMMNASIRHRDFVEIITRTAVINHGGGRAKIFEVAFPEPIHFLSKLYGTMSGRWPVACTFDGPAYDTHVKGMPEFDDVPVLECVALLDDGGKELTLLVTNRDARQDHTARVEVKGFAPQTEARTRTVAGKPTDLNVWNEPPRVKLVEGQVEAGNAFACTFPPCSVTEILLEAAK